MGEDPLEHGHLDHGQQLLRRRVRQGTEPRPLAAHEDDGFHLLGCAPPAFVVLVLGATVVRRAGRRRRGRGGAVVVAALGAVVVAAGGAVVVADHRRGRGRGATGRRDGLQHGGDRVALGFGTDVPDGTKATVMSWPSASLMRGGIVDDGRVVRPPAP